MSVTIRETKHVVVQSTVADLTIGSMKPFLRECEQAGLPAHAKISITSSGESAIRLKAEYLKESDNRPQISQARPSA